jgi:hypothetical protein
VSYERAGAHTQHGAGFANSFGSSARGDLARFSALAVVVRRVSLLRSYAYLAVRTVFAFAGLLGAAASL